MTKQSTLGAFISTSRSNLASPSADVPIKKPTKAAAAKTKTATEAATAPADVPSVDLTAIDNLEDMIEPSWREQLKDEFTKPYWKKLKEELKTKYSTETVFPPLPKVFSAFWLCPFKETRVVIIGQDPYHGYGQAEGLCFSVPKGEKIPSSLHNIYRELVSDIPGFKKPTHGNLVDWGKQGVLLLNHILTVKSASPNAHKNIGWALFTDAVVAALVADHAPRVWMLWGSFAQTKAKAVSHNSQLTLKTTHPSGLSAHKGFIGSKHFSKCNEFLKSNGESEIEWQV